VTQVDGHFARGDCVLVRSAAGAEVARGLIAYDAGDAQQLLGRNTRDIAIVLGHAGRAAMIHRDDLVLTASGVDA
jgi:glutamate 5-kinase